MRKVPGRTFFIVSCVTLVMLLGVTALAGIGPGTAPEPGQGNTLPAGAALPSAEVTYPASARLPAPTMPPLPTPEPLPRPPDAVALPLTTSLAPNVTWGVQTAGSLTIWVGQYSDKPVPNIALARPVVAWNEALYLVDLSVSPDKRSLAVITVPAPGADHEGIPLPTWLSSIDLSTNQVQSIPDYDRHYDLYYEYSGGHTHIPGWLDNERIAVYQIATFRPAVASKDGSQYAWFTFPPEDSSASDAALSPDRTTFFSAVGGPARGLWLHNADGSDPRKLSDLSPERSHRNPMWSSNGRYIAYLSPSITLQDGQWRANHSQASVWVLDLSSNIHRVVPGEQTWDASPAWSADSSKIAFLRADISLGVEQGL